MTQSNKNIKGWDHIFNTDEYMVRAYFDSEPLEKEETILGIPFKFFGGRPHLDLRLIDRKTGAKLYFAQIEKGQPQKCASMLDLAKKVKKEYLDMNTYDPEIHGHLRDEENTRYLNLSHKKY